jgi:endonuclease/exonuclease/phosphatase (EEP) superfamily protein YafD
MQAFGRQYIPLLRWLGYLTILASILSLYDRIWLFELFTHFTVQYLVILTLLAIFFLYRRNKLSLVFLVFIALNLYKINDQATAQISGQALAGQSIKIATLNVDFSGTEYARVEKFIQDYSADILLLNEITPLWLQQLDELKTMYPHSYLAPKDDAFGMAIFSRFPIVSSKTIILDAPLNPALVSEVDINGTKVMIYGVHLFAPMTNNYFHARNRQLKKLAAMIEENNSPVIVLGDFNITTWSYYFKDFIRTTSLKQSTAGQGLQPTWPSYFFPFYIQLDHILLSEEFHVINSKSEKYAGSDHFPLVAEISLTGL